MDPGSASLLFPVDPGSATPVGHLMKMVSRISEDPTRSEQYWRCRHLVLPGGHLVLPELMNLGVKSEGEWSDLKCSLGVDVLGWRSDRTAGWMFIIKVFIIF